MMECWRRRLRWPRSRWRPSPNANGLSLGKLRDLHGFPKAAAYAAHGCDDTYQFGEGLGLLFPRIDEEVADGDGGMPPQQHTATRDEVGCCGLYAHSPTPCTVYEASIHNLTMHSPAPSLLHVGIHLGLWPLDVVTGSGCGRSRRCK